VSCKFAIWKNDNYFNAYGFKPTKSFVKKIIKGKAKMNCKSKKTGNPYKAIFSISEIKNGRPTYNMEFDNSK